VFNLTRLFAILTVALMAAQPVMACCLVGHDAAVQVSEPPCHDTGMDMAPTDDGEAAQGTDDCPGCFDCDGPLIKAQGLGDGAVLAASSTDIPFAVLAARFSGFAHPQVIFKTGPPGEPQLPLSTPISLKQRLLI